MVHRRFSRYAGFVLVYNVAVVLFGAVVRATESGAGCGANWPTCRGSLIPSGGTTETVIEFIHRGSSGVALMLVAFLAVWAVRQFPRGNPARLMAIVSAVLIANEALIGAALVLFEWVASDQSVGRVVSIVVHLVNTFLLLASLALAARFSGGGSVPRRPLAPERRRLVVWGAAALLVVGAAGAITALGDTLFPPESVGGGFASDLAGTLIVRLRWIHPVLAVGTAAYLWWFSGRYQSEGPWLRGLIALQVGAGVINVALLAPLGMQVVHLLLADALWLGFVWVACDVLSERSPVAA